MRSTEAQKDGATEQETKLKGRQHYYQLGQSKKVTKVFW